SGPASRRWRGGAAGIACGWAAGGDTAVVCAAAVVVPRSSGGVGRDVYDPDGGASDGGAGCGGAGGGAGRRCGASREPAHGVSGDGGDTAATDPGGGRGAAASGDRRGERSGA